MSFSVDRRGVLKLSFGAVAAYAGAASGGLAAMLAASGGAAAEALPSTVKVGLSNQLPYAFLDDKGELTGQSPDVLRAALAGSGVTNFEPTVAEFSALIPGLLAKRFDVIATGLFIRPKRCEVIAYGNIDSTSRESMIVKKGNPLGIHSLEDVKKNPDVRMALLRGGVEESYADAAGVPKSQWVTLPDTTTLLAAVQGGRADVGFNTLVINYSTFEKMPDSGLEFVENFVDPVVDGKPAIDYAAMGFRQEDVALREAYNAGLAKLLASGELAAINKKYGLPEALSPTASTPTPEELCKG
jgi:polar amino acid transport system substrate-binding protein